MKYIFDKKDVVNCAKKVQKECKLFDSLEYLECLKFFEDEKLFEKEYEKFISKHLLKL